LISVSKSNVPGGSEEPGGGAGGSGGVIATIRPPAPLPGGCGSITGGCGGSPGSGCDTSTSVWQGFCRAKNKKRIREEADVQNQ
jgi:hypothetical protein